MKTIFREVSKTECLELRSEEGELLSRGYVRLRTDKPTQIFRLKTPRVQRRNGYATRLMSEIVGKYGSQTITLLPNPSPVDGMSYEKLREWYGRFGFVDQPGKKTMVRNPSA